ncbi:xylose repressor XylR [Thermoclostridium stercorarium subsp. stercorarium DSM 8532]|jgi:predicted NBD/HSP70 family sugar kinase|uniref:Xylose repressor XylR n=3 Tax=Thermoclostridium stercorarium TaxID=1510 RepID=L7VQB7_THES1|nr:ROK family transcriptional regulator [Thermoclostridium stercorarium]AGC67748.1 xylose repressor XylR [Thermoclostridium stercorarium subsp. stercorarium DSM 8532]AGI38796.1 transcriptional regulator [Thermoclostridium stercorarium subsp. stercorarium DSM 8532]ANW98160.1 XylR family transcriptional regulator [Thermoclostridium stercorarium subsp. thermolacticum DSM 2910]ANX00702.1 XylR family transcriptional regulator [Thermoclostridium stercorarium subsp. leptospartum DSM 9219]UZQ86316.1 R
MVKEFKSPLGKLSKNCKQIYQYIYRYGAVTRSEIERHTGFPMSTLVRAMNSLESNGLIYASETGESELGRKPRIYRICPDAGYIIAVDITRTYTQVALLDLELNILNSRTFGMYSSNTPDETIGRIIEIINEFISPLDKGKILGIGLGVVGPVDKENGVILNPEHFSASGWKNVSIKKILQEKTGFPVYIDDGANAAVLAEFRKGCGRHHHNIAYLIAGVGLRLGIIVNGKLLERQTYFGHTVIDKNGKDCICGKKGCLEEYFSLNVLLEEFIDEIKKGKSSIILEKVDYDLSSISFDHFCEAAKSGDVLANDILRKAAGNLAVGLGNLICILNPEIIVLGGTVFRKCPQLKTYVESEVSKHCPSTVFSNGELGENAVIIGAGSLVLEDYIE